MTLIELINAIEDRRYTEMRYNTHDFKIVCLFSYSAYAELMQDTTFPLFARVMPSDRVLEIAGAKLYRSPEMAHGEFKILVEHGE